MNDIGEQDDTAPAPGDLEVLQRFLNLHDHDATGRSVDPPTETVRAFLVDRGLITEEERFTDSDRETYLELARAFRALIRTGEGEPLSLGDAAVIDRVGVDAGLRRHFHARMGRPWIPGARAAGAFGRASRWRSWRGSTGGWSA